MKIYFAGAVRGGRDDTELYSQIINYLTTFGEVLTEHLGKKELSVGGENLSDKEIHDRDVEWLQSANVMVAEVSIASLGVGYEVSRAVNENKKILCLFRSQDGKKLSAMIAGCPKIINREYSNFEEAKAAIDEFFSAIPK